MSTSKLSIVGLTLAVVFTVAACDAGAPAIDAGPSGELDPDFGSNGVARLQDIGAELGILGFEVQDDGAMLLYGASLTQPPGEDSVIRLNADGQPDSNFGIDGRRAWTNELRFPLHLLADGRWLSLGDCDAGARSCLARFDSNYDLDPSFGSAGVTRIEVRAASRLVVDSEDRIVVIGGQKSLFRFTADGAADDSFGSTGTINLPAAGYPGEFVIQPDGRIVVLAGDPQNQDQPALIHLSPDGVHEKTVLVGPGASNPDNPEVLEALRMEVDGGLVVTGCRQCYASDKELVAYAFTPDLQPDTSLGSDGVAVLDGQGARPFGFAVALAARGDVLAGFSSVQPGLDGITIRSFLPDGAINTAFGDSGAAGLPLEAADLPINTLGWLALRVLPDARIVGVVQVNETILAARFWP